MTERSITVEQLEKALRSLPDTDRLEVNAVDNLLITDASGRYVGYIDMATGEVDIFEGTAEPDARP